MLPVYMARGGPGHKSSTLSPLPGGTSLRAMTEPPVLTFYLEDGLRQSAQAGRHNFIGLVAGVARQAGYRVEYRPNSVAERLQAETRPGHALYHMDGPTAPRALIFRRVYHYPFWAIEPEPARWDWRVARTGFPAGNVPRREADRFYRFWRTRLFGDAADQARRDGFVYVPLQGRLLDRRSFQTCSPLDMLRAVLAHDRDRPVIAALHPKESYCEAELQALEALDRDSPRLTLRVGEMQRWLAGCDYVVSQNSSAAFNGFFFGKPAVLFARSDFHHIAANVVDLGVAAALEAGPQLHPDYAGYLHWVWQVMSINAGRPEAPDRIRAALARAGWPT